MTEEPTLKRSDIILIFALALLARVLWALFSGLGPEAGVDFDRWDAFSSAILQGRFNLETTVVHDPNLDTRLFIAAPLYPYALALAKLVFQGQWFAGLGIIQILISSISVVYLAATARLIFKSRAVALTAGVVYALYLPTLYYAQLPSQESLFQSFFVISFYGLCRYNTFRDWRSLLFFSLFFTLALLTKSHVILMVPLVCALVVFCQPSVTRALAHVAIFLGIIALLTLPYGLYNLRVNGVYVISTSGSGGHFLTAHNDDFYTWLIRTPPKGTPEFERLADLRFSAFSKQGIPNDASHKERQSIYLRRGLDWIAANPSKALKLRVHNLLHYLQPGYSLRFQSFRNWLVALVFNVPIYILAYIELIKQLKTPRRHLPAYIVFVTMLLFVLIFYAQNRFRLITIEPIYVLYAAPGLLTIGSWIRSRLATKSFNLQG
ncbi:MAG: hypothetical protein RLZZ117_2561 [Cyanobacteriota bacterium]|jgi:hypothetical protein